MIAALRRAAHQSITRRIDDAVGTGEEAGSDLRCWLQMDIVAKQVCLSVHSAVLYVRGLGALPR